MIRMFERLINDDAWTRPRDVSVFKRLLGNVPVQILDVGARGGLHRRARGKTIGGGHLVHGDALYYNDAELDAAKPGTS